MLSIPNGDGAEDEGVREIGGGGVVARALKGNGPEMSLPPRARSDIGRVSVQWTGDSQFHPRFLSTLIIFFMVSACIQISIGVVFSLKTIN
jgi:hypothetical protein